MADRTGSLYYGRLQDNRLNDLGGLTAIDQEHDQLLLGGDRHPSLGRSGRSSWWTPSCAPTGLGGAPPRRCSASVASASCSERPRSRATCRALRHRQPQIHRAGMSHGRGGRCLRGLRALARSSAASRPSRCAPSFRARSTPSNGGPGVGAPCVRPGGREERPRGGPTNMAEAGCRQATKVGDTAVPRPQGYACAG
jgi:hypothetical protein